MVEFIVIIPIVILKNFSQQFLKYLIDEFPLYINFSQPLNDILKLDEISKLKSDNLTTDYFNPSNSI